MDEQDLEFEWDEAKAKANLELTTASLSSLPRRSLETRDSSASTTAKITARLIALARAGLEVYRVVYTWRSKNRIRIITAQKANQEERQIYYREILFSEIEARREGGKDPTHPDAPEAEPLPQDFWKSARVVVPPGKTSVHLRLDRDVVEWFKASGKGHLTRMNAVLRAYVEAQKRSA